MWYVILGVVCYVLFVAFMCSLFRLNYWRDRALYREAMEKARADFFLTVEEEIKELERMMQ